MTPVFVTNVRDTTRERHEIEIFRSTPASGVRLCFPKRQTVPLKSQPLVSQEQLRHAKLVFQRHSGSTGVTLAWPRWRHAVPRFVASQWEVTHASQRLLSHLVIQAESSEVKLGALAGNQLVSASMDIHNLLPQFKGEEDCKMQLKAQKGASEWV